LSPSLPRAPGRHSAPSQNNRSPIPFAKVYDVIDGREAVAVHGPRDMQVWGNEYWREGAVVSYGNATPEELSSFARGASSHWSATFQPFRRSSLMTSFTRAWNRQCVGLRWWLGSPAAPQHNTLPSEADIRASRQHVRLGSSSDLEPCIWHVSLTPVNRHRRLTGHDRFGARMPGRPANIRW